MSIFRRVSFSFMKSENHNNTNSYKMEDPEKFEKNQAFTKRDANLFAPQLVKDMTWNRFHERILDHGCRSGATGFNHILPQVYLHDSHLYSVDKSDDLISYAEMKYPHPCVTYAIGDIMSDTYPFKYIKFDKIFSIYILQYNKDYKSALNRFFDALSPGGMFGFTMITDYYCHFLHYELSKIPKWREYMEGYEKYVPGGLENDEDSEQTLREALENVGFEIIKLKAQILDWNFETLDAAVDFYMATSSFTKNVPKDSHEALKEECRQLMAKAFNIDPELDSYTMKYETIYAVVEKPGVVAPRPAKPVKRRGRLSLP